MDINTLDSDDIEVCAVCQVQFDISALELIEDEYCCEQCLRESSK